MNQITRTFFLDDLQESTDSTEVAFVAQEQSLYFSLQQYRYNITYLFNSQIDRLQLRYTESKNASLNLNKITR